MTITATLINLYHVCHRELWLHANQIQMEQTSEVVADGKFIGDTTYEQRPEKYTQVELPGVKIDFYDAKNGVVHETKRSDKMEQAHVAQVKYYLYVLGQHGIAANYGILEYPKQRHTERVDLTDEDRRAIEVWKMEIEEIVGREVCPPVINKPFCKKCSYYDFCYVGE
ncbi:MAG: CRISPR-associated protein Cas4 [Saprospiraceae bacterium]|nr:CRISPR-associated protein Cas4 [Saprospiraceae bacterium]MCF8252467.1 CRISPR-associated protein Cas4 [Saprospiraceae bacterium]MCF8282334.1 CRISPR-associated protein Cas4 [Bacteroidales bacterium]MCF8314046.1 CRISPR-associated protein Cas4 [Saprospiraceae bacterium]MCF8442784.1 CRISPR-associated protein Cas4 [Saprospiraceae bacterium]